MNATRAFRIIGRINSVLLLFVLVVGAIAVVVSLVGEAIGMARFSGASPGGEPAAGGAGDDRVELAAPVAIEGTAVTVLPLNGVQELGGFSSGEAGTWTRNLLFHDGASGRMRWLRADDLAAIGGWEVLREGEGRDPYGGDGEDGRGATGKGDVLGVMYEISEADTDGDGLVGPSDRRHVWLSDATGEGPAAVLRDVDEVRGRSAPRGGRLFVFFRRAGKDLAAELDLRARRLVREAPIPAR